MGVRHKKKKKKKEYTAVEVELEEIEVVEDRRRKEAGTEWSGGGCALKMEDMYLLYYKHLVVLLQFLVPVVTVGTRD